MCTPDRIASLENAFFSTLSDAVLATLVVDTHHSSSEWDSSITLDGEMGCKARVEPAFARRVKAADSGRRTDEGAGLGTNDGRGLGRCTREKGDTQERT